MSTLINSIIRSQAGLLGRRLFRLGILTSLKGFKPADLSRDLMAGMMLFAVAIPSQIATAHLAGMPLHTGLYAFIAGTLAMALFGGNRYLSVGADSTIAPVFAGAITLLAASQPAAYPSLVIMLALLVGIILLVIGFLQAGWIADLLSIPVITGFLAGIAVHIVIGQLPNLLGIPAVSGTLPHQIAGLASHLGDARWLDLLIGAGVLAIIVGTKRLSKNIPGPLVALVTVITLSWLLDWQAQGVTMLGGLSAGWPTLSLPLADAAALSSIGSLAVAISLICMMQTSAVAREYPSTRGISDNISKDFAAVGVGNLLSGLCGAFPVDTSPSSTALVYRSGGRSQLAGLFAVGLVILFLVFCGSLFRFVPMAALAGVLIYVASGIFHIGDMKRIIAFGGFEPKLMFASILLVVLLPIEAGVTLSIFLSLAHGAQTIIRPSCTELARLPDSNVWWTPMAEQPGERVAGIMVFSPSAPINFTNISYIQDSLIAAIAEREPHDPVQYLVIDASGVTSMDYSGSDALRSLIVTLRARRIDVAISRLSFPRTRRAASQAGLILELGQDRLYLSIDDAVQAFLNPKQETPQQTDHPPPFSGGNNDEQAQQNG